MSITRQSYIAFAAILAVAAAAACSPSGSRQQSSAPAPQTSPELAGAWYEVYFDPNSSEIDQRGRTIISNVAYVTANNTATRVNIIGKTDSVGTAEANMVLSRRRAEAVRNALISAGVPSNRIDSSWTGEMRQEVATRDEASERRNRVVDITVVRQPR